MEQTEQKLWQRRPVKLVAFGLCFWLVLFVTFATASILDRVNSGQSIDWEGTLKLWSVSFGHWVILAPPLFHWTSSDRFVDAPLKGKMRIIALLLVFFVVVLFAYLFAVAAPVFGQSFIPFMQQFRFVQWIWDFILFGVVLLFGYQSAVLRRTREARLTAAELGQRLAEQQASLSAREAEYLRGRLGSHFVMNALSNLVGLMRLGHIRRAEEATILLSEILRSMTGASGTEECIPLDEEIEDSRKYLSFQQIRFPELKSSFDVPNDTADVLVPRQILQPILENVFKHGPRGGSVDVGVTAKLDSGLLHMMVQNNMTSDTGDTVNEGEGMQLTKLRLQMAYGDKARLMREASGGCYRVTICLPELPSETRDERQGS